MKPLVARPRFRVRVTLESQAKRTKGCHITYTATGETRREAVAKARRSIEQENVSSMPFRVVRIVDVVNEAETRAPQQPV